MTMYRYEINGKTFYNNYKAFMYCMEYGLNTDSIKKIKIF